MGTNGQSEQWKCEADLDSRVRFGSVDVSCEGYDSSNDEYVLAGSCGLIYTLDYTDQHNDHDEFHSYYAPSKSGGGFFNTILLLVFAVVFFIIFKQLCLTPSVYSTGTRTGSHWGGGSGPYGGGNGPYGGGNGPNGPGCNPTYTQHAGSSGDGWWSGLATGGLLGYMFGRPRYGGYGGYGGGYGGYGGYGGAPFGGGYRRSTFGSSGGTHRSTGFGGTSRR